MNPCAAPYVPRKEVDKVNRKDEEQQKCKRISKLVEGYDFGWKIPSKSIIKRNTNGSATAPPTHIRNNNRHAIFEDSEEDAEEEDYEFIKKDKPSDEMKTKISFDAENLSADDVEEIICKHNEKHSEGSLGA